MPIIDRIKWMLTRRPRLKMIDSWAHWSAYIDPATELAGNNRVGNGCNVCRSRIGRHTYIVNARIVNADIGAFCSIGSGVNIGGLGSHPTDYVSTHPIFYSPLCQSGKTFARETGFEELKSVSIGNDVWIGARALILDGVKIGDGAIIAAGAVVTLDVLPYAIVGGVPAKVIRTRFDSAVIEALLKWKWWHLPDDVLAQLAPRFCESSDLTIDRLAVLQEIAAEAKNVEAVTAQIKRSGGN